MAQASQSNPDEKMTAIYQQLADQSLLDMQQLHAVISPNDAEISAMRWKLSAVSAQSNAAQPAPEVPLFVLGPFRLVHSVQAIRFRAGTWLSLGLSWGGQK